MKLYAGIGDHKYTPTAVQFQMTSVAELLYGLGWKLRSGGADQADTAFEDGSCGVKEIFRASHANELSMQIAKGYHPAWDKCTPYVQKLHGRNVMIILGQDFRQPVKFVACYTTNGKPKGGTGMGMKIAIDFKIPIFNFYFGDDEITRMMRYAHSITE